MELDYLFPITSARKIEILRTNRKGAPVHAFSTDVAKPNDFASRWPDRKNALNEMCGVLDISEVPVVVVSLDLESDRKDLSPVLAHGTVWLDIKQLAWPLTLYSVASKDRHFSELCRLFEVTTEFGDCLALSQLYFKMMTRYKTSLFGEEVVREAGGRALASIRGLLGV